MRRSLVDLSLPVGLALAAAATLLVQGARPGAAFGMLVVTAALLGAVLLGLLRAAGALLGARRDSAPVDSRHRDDLAREKTLVLRSLKDLDFDHAMGKLSDRDFAEMSARLRARAVRIMKELDERPDYRGRIEREVETRLHQAAETAETAAPRCASCGTANDGDATFCKKCGQRLSS